MELGERRPDVIVLDAMISSGDGVALFDLIERDETYSRIPLVLLHPDRFDTDSHPLADDSRVRLIKKPIDFVQFRTTLYQLTSEGSLRAG